MKKMILGLLLTAISGVAHAGMTAVTDKTETDAIKTATKMALGDALLVCVSGDAKTEMTGSQFSDFVDRAMFVYRNDNGQPVVQFTSTYFDNKRRNDFAITTDSTGRKITSMSFSEANLSADKTVNLGTIAKPNLQVVPGQMETTMFYTCIPK